jgi:competence protein ComEC
LAAIAGILLDSFFGHGKVMAVVSGLLVLPVVLFFRKHGGVCWAVTVVVFLLLHHWNWELSPARALATDLERASEVVMVKGVVTGEPRIGHSGVATFPVKLQEMSALDDGRLITRAPLSVQVRWSGKVPVYGDLLNFQGTPGRPAPPRNPGEMDYGQWLARHGIYTRIDVDPSIPGTIESGGHGNPLMAFAIQSRRRMEEILSIDLAGSPEVRGAIEGICLGVIEHSPEGFTEDFRFTGTMHLFAVSGLHVGMLAVILWFVLKALRIPRTWAVILTIPSLFFYALVTGMKMGSVRSATMASILLLGITLFRRSPSINTLAVAAFAQLAIDTNVLFSAGWQFSYSVVLAILAIAPRLEALLIPLHHPDPFLPPQLLTQAERWGFRIWHHASGLAVVSGSAWIGAILPTLCYFHLISFSALGANLLAVPLAFLVIALGSLSLMSGSFSAWVAGAFNNSNWLVTKLLLFVVQTSALMPASHFFVGPPAPSLPELTMLDLHGGSCTVIRDGRQVALLDAGRRKDVAGTILPCLEAFGVNSISTCFITRVDASHLGGLSAVIREVHIADILACSPDSGSSIGKGMLKRVDFKSSTPGKSTPLTERVSGTQLLPPEDHYQAFRLMLGEIPILILSSADKASDSFLTNVCNEELHAEVLVLPLGGAEFASTLALISRISPKVLISPVNPYKKNGVPSREWNRLLRERRISLYRQDDCGALTIGADSDAPMHPVITPFIKSSSLFAGQSP